MGDKVLYGLIGYPLEHTFSPAYFNDKFRRENINAEYRVMPISLINEYKPLLEAYPNLAGLNVTIPFKEEIISQIDDIDADAAKVKAVNCIRFVEGKTIGYNTDIIGFAQSLSPLLQPHMTDALVLGSGGASKAVRFVLDKMGINFLVVSREQKESGITYSEVDADVINKHKLIVNTTPVGMFPYIDNCPNIPYHSLTGDHLLFDLVYNPAITKFLQHGKKYSAAIKNGQEMLELQAEASWTVWNL